MRKADRFRGRLTAMVSASVFATCASAQPAPRSGAVGTALVEARAARVDQGLGLVSAKLMRLWNPNCQVPGADAVTVRVRVRLDRTGALEAPPQLVDFADLDAITDPVSRAGAARALSAVERGAPFEGLAVADYEVWKQFVVRFDGKVACRTTD